MVFLLGSIKKNIVCRKEWVRSSNPHLISLNLRNLQEILDPNRSMDIDVFNLGVRLIACDETAVMFEPKCHLLDLKFSVCYLIYY